MRKLLHIFLFIFITNVFIFGIDPHIHNKLYTFDEFDSLCRKDSIMYKVILKDTFFDVTKYKL